MVIASLGEVISIGAVLPFLGVLVDPQKVFDSELASPIIKFLNINNADDFLFPLTLVFVIAAIISGMMRILLLWAQTRFGHAIGADLSFKIYRNTLYQNYSVHLSRNSSEIIAGITEKANGVVGQIILPLLVLSSSLLLMIAIMVTLLSIDPIVALSAFICFGMIYSIIILATKRRLYINGKRISSLLSKRLKALHEGLGGIRDVILDGSQSTYASIYRSADIPLRHAQASNQVIAGSPRFGIEALGMVLIAVLAYSLVKSGGGIGNAIPVLGALAIGAQRMLPVLQQGYSSWSNIKGSEVVLNDALELLEQPLQNNEIETGDIISFNKYIEFKNLYFRYSPDGPWVLRDLDLKIKKGSKIGFIGATGSGKTTLLDIIMGLLEGSSGKFLIDDTIINNNNRCSWRANIAHVPQSIYLSDSTIAENIAFGIPLEKINIKRVKIAAKMAQISETIEGWSSQYDMTVGERGVRLSGGQRQRIGIARAIYKKANVIVFDEATSALDNMTERAVMDSIDKISRDITILIIAHRLTSLSGCDIIMQLQNGRIIKKGSYHEMVK